jgi:hypothetical protein
MKEFKNQDTLPASTKAEDQEKLNLEITYERRDEMSLQEPNIFH